MYKCNNCDCEFEEADFISAEKLFGVDDLFPDRRGGRVAICPMCGSDDFGELEEEDEF